MGQGGTHEVPHFHHTSYPLKKCPVLPDPSQSISEMRGSVRMYVGSLLKQGLIISHGTVLQSGHRGFGIGGGGIKSTRTI